MNKIFNLRITAKIVLFILFAIKINVAQSNNQIILPTPQIGWDSLQNKMTYPELARRAILWGAYEVNLKIDSTGENIDCKIKLANYEIDNCNYKMTSYDSLFIRYLQYEFRDLKWNPGQINGIPTTMEITIPIVYYFEKQRKTAPTIFIKSVPSYPIVD